MNELLGPFLTAKLPAHDPGFHDRLWVMRLPPDPLLAQHFPETTEALLQTFQVEVEAHLLDDELHLIEWQVRRPEAVV